MPEEKSSKLAACARAKATLIIATHDAKLAGRAPRVGTGRWTIRGGKAGRWIRVSLVSLEGDRRGGVGRGERDRADDGNSNPLALLELVKVTSGRDHHS
jgi:hypothetical protein